MRKIGILFFLVLGFIGCKKDEPAQPQQEQPQQSNVPFVEKKVRGGFKAITLKEENFYVPTGTARGISVEFPKNARKVLYSTAISKNTLSVKNSFLTTQLNELIQYKDINIELIDYSTKVRPLQEGDHWSNFYIMNSADYERFSNNQPFQYYGISSKKDFKNGVVELDYSLFHKLFVTDNDKFNLGIHNETPFDQYVNVEISAIVRTYFYKNSDGTETELLENSPLIITEQLYQEMRKRNSRPQNIMALLENVSERDFKLIINAFGVLPYDKTFRTDLTDSMNGSFENTDLKGWLLTELPAEDYQTLKQKYPNSL